MTVLRTPPGTKDVLPVEAAELRLIEDAVRTVFHEFGYGEVITPALEYEEVLALSEEKAFLTGFRLLDESGKVLILRPDLTTPIARLVGSRLRAGETPHRVFSISDIFRRNSPQRGQENEFRQAGAELLGSSLPQADAEVVAVACRALERAGLEDFRVGLGQVSFFKALLDGVTGRRGPQGPPYHRLGGQGPRGLSGGGGAGWTAGRGSGGLARGARSARRLGRPGAGGGVREE